MTKLGPTAVGKRLKLLDFLTWVAIILASAAIGYLVCYWMPTTTESQIGRTEEERGNQPARSIHNQPVPIDIASPTFRRLKREALLGSKSAALNVMRAYEECVPAKGIGGELDKKVIAECDRSFDHWVAIAAANGVGEAANLIFNELSASDRCEDVYRARFWSSRIPWWGSEQPWVGADAQLRDKERRCGW